MIRLLHVFDGRAAETEHRAVRLLLQRTPSDRFAHVVAATSFRASRSAAALLECEVHRADRRLSLVVSSAPALRRLVRAHRIDIIHAWGPDALAACKAASTHQRIIVSGVRFVDVEQVAKWLLRVHPSPVAIVSSQIARSQLARFGVPPGNIAVVREPVDFAEITRARAADARQRLVRDNGPVVLAPGPARRDAGQFETLWAAAMLQQIFPAIRVVVPENAPETQRLSRMATSLGLPEMLITPGDSFSIAELVAAADVLVVAPRSEADPGPIGWAMAAGVAVVGAARRSVAELIADRSNGLLCMSNQPRRIAAALLRLLEDPVLRGRLAETARGQAFDVFSARGYVDNLTALYSNVAQGRLPTDGIRDAAMVA